MTDTEILDVLDASLTRWREKNKEMFFDMQLGEVVFTTSARDTRSLRECLIEGIERQIIAGVTKKLASKP